MYISIKDKTRFEAKIKIVESGCWEWQACINTHGYGHFKFNGKPLGAHIFSYLLYKGDITPGLFVCHECDNKKCVNPSHFFLGTNLDNVRDAQKKGLTKEATCPSHKKYERGCRCDACVLFMKNYYKYRNNLKKLKTQY